MGLDDSAGAVFAESHYGVSILMAENDEEIEGRWSLVWSTLVVGLVQLLFAAMFIGRTTARAVADPTARFLSQSVLVVYVLNVSMQVLHFADNIHDPSLYHEPEKLYAKRFFSTMEGTYLYSYPMGLIGAVALRFLILGLEHYDNRAANRKEEVTDVIILGAKMALLRAILGSLTLGHYLVDPLPQYTPRAHFTIAGDGCLCIFHGCIAARIWFLARDNARKFTEKRANLGPDMRAQAVRVPTSYRATNSDDGDANSDEEDKSINGRTRSHHHPGGEQEREVELKGLGESGGLGAPRRRSRGGA